MPPATQKSLLCPDGTENFVITETSVPSPGPGEILVKVESAALNPADWKVFGPFRDRIPPPPICGLDGAGVVVALGSGVTAFSEGDRV